MPLTLLSIAVVIALIDWFAVARDIRRLEYFAKPMVIVALLAWLWLNTGFHGHMVWFALGLALSLVGDILLMLPRARIPIGPAAFFLAQLAYLIGFNESLPPVNLASLALALIVTLTTVQIFMRISTSMKASGNNQWIAPGLAYAIAISLMLISALLTLVREEWPPLPALVASTGALLFFLSDTLLAWNLFVSPLRYRRLPATVCYHLGQILITFGVIIFTIK